MKLVIDLPDEAVKWFKGKGFIPIGQYLMVDEAMKKAEPLSEVLDDAKREIAELRDSWEKDCYHDEAEALNIALKIIDKHIGKESEDK